MRSCTWSRSRSLRGKPETFPWAQGGPCDHAAVAGKPRLWPGGGRKVRVRGEPSAPPKRAVRPGKRGWRAASRSFQQRPSSCAVPLRCPGPHKMPLCRLEGQAPWDQGRAVRGIAPPEAESAARLYRTCFRCCLLHTSGGSPQGKGVTKRTKESKWVLQNKT